ncbi:MAG: hypothetical protein IT379_19405, partial [Deltaproteobacteria bacterium]|nr:hypothetical protein [Deltaproteobacteria bacterium]
PADTGPPDTGPRTDGGPGSFECVGGCGAGEMCCPVGIVGQCIEATTSGECPLPDLTVSTETLMESAYVTWEYFAEDDCAIFEGCIGTPGWRRLLRFSTETPNIGTGDMTLGPPTEENPHFEYSACHMHWHFNGYADYRLLAADGTEVGAGHKQAFCLLDSHRWVTDDPTVERTQRYTCDYQGIQRGWSDVYDSALDCQWIDITDVAVGDYTLRVHINHERVLPELSYDNNVTTIAVNIPEDTAVDPTAPCTRRLEGPSRDCGWTSFQPDGTTTSSFDCTPGAMVTVGCGATSCDTAACEGDPVMRVCAGDEPCVARYALAQDDDCGARNYCPSTTLTCPDGGKILVLTAPYQYSDDYSCQVVAM